MASKRMSMGTVKSLGGPFSKEMIGDMVDVEPAYRYNIAYDHREEIPGSEYAVWAHSSDTDPVTTGSYVEELIKYNLNVAKDDPVYYRKRVSRSVLDGLRKMAGKYGAPAKKASLKKIVDRIEKMIFP